MLKLQGLMLCKDWRINETWRTEWMNEWMNEWMILKVYMKKSEWMYEFELTIESNPLHRTIIKNVVTENLARKCQTEWWK